MQMPSEADDSVCSFGVTCAYTDVQQVFDTVFWSMNICGMTCTMNFTSFETLCGSQLLCLWE